MTVSEIAQQCGVDRSTVHRAIAAGCPCIQRGAKGRGKRTLLDLAQFEQWRGRTNGPAGLTPHEVVQQIARMLWDTLDRDHVDLRTGVDREAAAAVLIIVWEQVCKSFGVSFKFDRQPTGISSLMHIL